MVPGQTLPRRPIRTRLFGGIAALVTLVVVAGTVISVMTVLAGSTSQSERVRIHDLMDVQLDLWLAIDWQRGEAAAYAVARVAQDRDDYVAAIEREAAALQKLAPLAATDRTLADAGSMVAAATADWRAWAERTIGFGPRAGRAIGTAEREEGQRLEHAIDDALMRLSDVIHTRRDTSMEAQAAGNQRVVVLTVGVVTALVVLLAIVGAWFIRRISGPLDRLNRSVDLLATGGTVAFTPEHDDEIGALALAMERLRRELLARYNEVSDEADRASVYARLDELTSFASDEGELVKAAIATLGRLVPSERGDILLLNPSMNRLTVGGTWGANAAEAGNAANAAAPAENAANASE
jgi:CHASE3 domain sensor protein